MLRRSHILATVAVLGLTAYAVHAMAQVTGDASSSPRSGTVNDAGSLPLGGETTDRPSHTVDTMDGDNINDGNMPRPDTAGSSAMESDSVGVNSAFGIPDNMDPDMFNDFVTGSWDSNGDGTIDNSEWDTATPGWYGDARRDLRPFDSWDSDTDSTLSQMEMNDMITSSNLYRIYDTNGDNRISRSEAQRIPRR